MLMGLQLKGWGRYLRRNLQSVKGVLFGVLGVMVIGFWLVSMLFAPHGSGLPAESIREYGPAILLLYCLLNVTMSTGEKGIYFNPAEVNYLFSGPFSRRQVLAYKMVTNVFLFLPTTLFFSVFFRIHAASFIAAFAGLFLMFLFIYLLSLALNLIAITVGASLFSRMRKVVFFGLLALAGVFLLLSGGQALGNLGPKAIMERLNSSVVWQVLTLPLSSFFEVFLAGRVWPDLLLWALPALLVNAVLLGIVFWLDANYLETAAATSERVYNRIKKIRAGNLWADDGKARKVRFSLPMPPPWGGIGPILWRQLTTATRGLGKLAFLFVVFGLFMLGPILASKPEQGSGTIALSMAGFMAFLITMMLTTLVPFDFRGDVDRMDVLKALPILPWRVAVGQLLTPTLLLSGLEWLVLGIVAAIVLFRVLAGGGEAVSGSELNGMGLILAASTAFILPFNFLVFAMENLLFLLFPARVVGNQAGDFQAVGRNVLFVFAKMFGLAVVVGLAGVVGVVASLLSGSGPVGLAAAWLVLVACAVGMVPLVGMAFQLFDVSRDTPP